MRLTFCPLHAAAPELLAFVERMTRIGWAVFGVELGYLAALVALVMTR